MLTIPPLFRLYLSDPEHLVIRHAGQVVDQQPDTGGRELAEAAEEEHIRRYSTGLRLIPRTRNRSRAQTTRSRRRWRRGDHGTDRRGDAALHDDSGQADEDENRQNQRRRRRPQGGNPDCHSQPTMTTSPTRKVNTAPRILRRIRRTDYRENTGNA